MSQYEMNSQAPVADPAEVYKENLLLSARLQEQSSALTKLAAELEESNLRLTQAQARLQAACKFASVGRLASGIVHEINTPVQFIGDNLAFLQTVLPELFEFSEQVAGPEPKDGSSRWNYFKKEIPEAVEGSQEGLRRVNRIVQSMRSFFYPTAVGKSLTRLEEVVEASLSVSAGEWKYVCKVVTDFAPDLPPVPCHRQEISQVILNLIVNAAEAIREKGELGVIKISARKLDGLMELTIEDDGIGMSAAVQARIFDPFFTTKPLSQATGQGLAVAHEVLARHSGRIYFRSTEGRGTLFTLQLPLAS
ncbi:MAG: ATP-binding protein [Vulcanimicrobiota bacterium]